MKTLNAKDFQTRSELENKVSQLTGLTPDRKDNYKIVGTRAELANLNLDASSIFWGISCIANDPVPVRKSEPPDRGEPHDFGINGQKKKAPKKKK